MKRLLCILTVCLLTLGFVPSAAAAGTEPGSYEVDSCIDELLELRARKEGAADLQQLIGVFAKDPGRGEQWYVLVISRLFPERYDFSAYREALEAFVEEQPPANAATRELLALTLLEVGSESPFIDAAADEAPGQGGLMSLVFGLHLINAGAKSSVWNADSLAGAIIAEQKDDGGWAVMGDVGDVDVTAMTLQALAGAGADDAISSGIDYLSTAQQTGGGFASLGKYNPESGAQVLCALSLLGIDAASDSRFVKNGCTVFDSFEDFRCEGGGYAHDAGGEENASASRQVLQALAAYRIMFFGSRTDDPETSSHNGKTAFNISIPCAAVIACALLFIFKKRNIKSYAAVLIVCALALVLVNTLRITSPEDYYGASQAPSGAAVSTRISIRCDTVAGRKDFIPADGIILDECAIDVEEGATAYQQLVGACRAHGISLESEGTSGVPYVSGIAYIYEMEFGELSGWMFRVNGEFSAVGAGEAKLSEGDLVEWVYTCDLGHDVE